MFNSLSQTSLAMVEARKKLNSIGSLPEETGSVFPDAPVEAPNAHLIDGVDPTVKAKEKEASQPKGKPEQKPLENKGNQQQASKPNGQVFNKEKEAKNPVEDMRAYLASRGIPVTLDYCPELESQKLVMPTAFGRIYELYFDLKGRVLFNRQKMILVDSTEALAQSQATQLPLSSYLELESGVMYKIGDVEANHIAALVLGQTGDLNAHKIYVPADAFNLNKIVDFTSIPVNKVSTGLLENLKRIFSQGKGVIENIYSKDLNPRFKFVDFKGDNEFTLVSDLSVPLSATRAKMPGFPPISLTYKNGEVKMA